MPFGIDYTPETNVSPWGNASETKQETTSHSSNSSSSGGSAGWNPWQEKLGPAWTNLGNKGVQWIQSAYQNAQPQLWDTVQQVLNWSQAPPQEYLAGRDALVNSFQPTATQDFYEHSVRDPALREWEQVTRPALREAYAGNYYHSDRMRREAELGRDLALSLANKKSDLEFQSQESAKGRALQGAPIALNYAQFIPQTQANFLTGYEQSVNPLLTALTQYLSQRLQQDNWSSAHGSTVSHSASHSVTGVNKPPEETTPAPSSWTPKVYEDNTRNGTIAWQPNYIAPGR